MATPEVIVDVTRTAVPQIVRSDDGSDNISEELVAVPRDWPGRHGKEAPGLPAMYFAGPAAATLGTSLDRSARGGEILRSSACCDEAGIPCSGNSSRRDKKN